jgi:iron complex transport system substrate-binding protein
MRIGSLLPSATELLYAVGAGDEVVARTHECDYPPEAESLPVITSSAIDHTGRTCSAIDRHVRHAVHEGSSLYRLDDQMLRLLAPDLIVTQELCEVCAVAYAEVRRAAKRLPGEVPVISLEPTSLDDIRATAVVVGEATGHKAEGIRLAAGLAERINAIEAFPQPPSIPRVVCLEWTRPADGGRPLGARDGSTRRRPRCARHGGAAFDSGRLGAGGRGGPRRACAHAVRFRPGAHDGDRD